MDNSPPDAEQIAGERLDSWKEIASYLKRSVRSVQRWEAEEGMPVHRHLHEKRGTVYAFSSELDAWWKERGAILAEREVAGETALAPEPQAIDNGPGVQQPASAEEVLAPSPRAFPRAGLIGAGFALAVALVGVVAWFSRNGSGVPAGSRRPLPFKARDWVLVASFENQTGEPLFDGTVEYALERDLSNSRYVNVVPRERVGDVLRLMRKPANTRVDGALGREICLRDGKIRALLAGRIEKLGSKYLVSVELVDPEQGAMVASLSQEAAGAGEVLAAVRITSDRMRQILGEALPFLRQGERKLQEVTTPSLKALQLYSKADALMMMEGDRAAAVELLEQAVAEDPQFASAHIHLAWASYRRRPEEEWRPHAEAALRLSERTSERERYFIRGSYYDMLDHQRIVDKQPDPVLFQKAIAAYEALLSLYPDHFWGASNLVSAYRRHGRTNEAVRYGLRTAELRPRDFEANFGVAFDLAVMAQDPGRAGVYARRARELISPEIVKASPWGVAWVELFPAFDDWLGGDPQEALARAERFAQKLGSTPLEDQELAALPLGHFFLTLGKLETAEKLLERVSTPTSRFPGLAMVSYFRGDRAGLRERLSAALANPEPKDSLVGILLVRAGLLPEAERLISEQENTKSYDPGFIEVERAELALARGQTAEAIRQLKRGRERWPINSSNTFFLGTETLATALSQQGDVEGAVRVLELASGQKTRAIFHFVSAAHSWMRTQLLLAKLYRNVGRQEDARRIEGELHKLLAYADPDHVLLRELNRSEPAVKISAMGR